MASTRPPRRWRPPMRGWQQVGEEPLCDSRVLAQTREEVRCAEARFPVVASVSLAKLRLCVCLRERWRFAARSDECTVFSIVRTRPPPRLEESRIATARENEETRLILSSTDFERRQRRSQSCPRPLPGRQQAPRQTGSNCPFLHAHWRSGCAGAHMEERKSAISPSLSN